MAHLRRCWCGRLFRCEGGDHSRATWYWCIRRCPDWGDHGFGGGYITNIVIGEDAKFFQLMDQILGEAD